MNRHEKERALFRKRFSCSQFNAYIQLTLPFAAHCCGALTFCRASFKNVATLPVAAYCYTRSVAYLTSIGQHSQGTNNPSVSLLRIVVKNYYVGELSGGVKYLSENCPVGELSVGELSGRRNVLVGEVSWSEMCPRPNQTYRKYNYMN